MRELDDVASLRFASVYRAFESLEDFEAAITLLRAEREATGREPAHLGGGAAYPSGMPRATEDALAGSGGAADSPAPPH